MKEDKKITIHYLFWYFLIFSILGLIIETLYCYFMTGTWESRKGLIWGPFCPVYGVCGALLIWILNKIKFKSILQLFLGGFIIGSIAEYILSFALEAIYGIRFWNYDYLVYNLNGRISLIFSIYWGILSVILIKLVQPLIDKLVNKIKPNIRNIIEIVLFVFLVVDCIFTVWGIQTYQNRVLYRIEYSTDSNNVFLKARENIENNYFTNERISHTFPNLRTKNEKGEEIWIKTLIEKQAIYIN